MADPPSLNTPPQGSEVSSLWGITAYFNPAGYENKYRNFRTFRSSTRGQGLQLLTVELVLDGGPPVLQRDDADVHVVVRGDDANILWQKEALLNIGLRHLPVECRYVAWLDADVLFANDDWIPRTCAALETFCVVQPYSRFVQLPLGTDSPAGPEAAPGDDPEAEPSFGWGFSTHDRGWIHPYGRTGNAWAARRTVLDKHGFYDKLILGDADSFMAYALIGWDRFLSWFADDFPPALITDYEKWAAGIFQDVRARVGHVEGDLYHLWHGRVTTRRYAERRQILKNNDYDPHRHIGKTTEGILEWKTKNRLFKASVAEYFRQRREDERTTMEKSTKRVLITGMNGVVGGIVGRALCERYSVSALCRKPVEGIHTTIADIRDVEALKPAFPGIDVLLHFAAYTGNDGIRQIDVNIRGSYNLFEAAVQAGVRRVVFISSGATQEAYEREEPFRAMCDARLDDMPEPRPLLNHHHPVRPARMYGAAKACGEVIGRLYAETTDLSVICLRLGRVTPQNQPSHSRDAAVYLSHRDLIQFVEKAVTAPDDLKFGIYYGVSNNAARFRDLTPALDDLGYAPQNGFSWDPSREN